MPNLIQIHQKKISIGDKYTVSVNGQQVLKCARSLFKLYPLLTVSPIAGGPPVFEIEQRLAVLRPMYVFTFGQNKFELTTVSWWKRHYRIHMGKDVFDIYGHRGRKVSVFLNGRQVAWFQSAAVTFFSGDEYNIHADSGVSVDWMIAIALFWDSYYNRGNKSMINVNFGSLLQAQPFDKTWVPA
jgi:uncharacterized protein YxjI